MQEQQLTGPVWEAIRAAGIRISQDDEGRWSWDTSAGLGGGECDTPEEALTQGLKAVMSYVKRATGCPE